MRVDLRPNFFSTDMDHTMVRRQVIQEYEEDFYAAQKLKISNRPADDPAKNRSLLVRVLSVAPGMC